MNKRWHAWGVALVLTSVALSGCADKKSDSGGGGEPSSADFTANEYDRAIGNAGFRVTGSLTGTASAVDPASAAQIDILDLAQADGTDADKATLILDAKQTGLNVLASLRSMATPADAKSSASHFGGVARNVKVFGGTGVGPSALPETTAYMFATGLAQVRVEANTQSNKLVYVAVTPALRGADGAALATPDAANVQLHIVFPGSTIAGNAGIEGVTDGFLYYFFETVGVVKLEAADRAKIGEGLIKPEGPNTKPQAVGKVLVDDKIATVGTQEGDANITVTFDGSDSKDLDPGDAIQNYIWRVAVMVENGTFEKPTKDSGELSVVTGKTVTYNFTQPGPKLVELTVTDGRGESDTMPITFYVNQHRVIPGGRSLHSDTAGAGTSCNEPVNCFRHTVTIGVGIQSAKLEVKNKAGTANGRHIDLYEPDTGPGNGNPVASNTPDQPLTVNKDKLTKLGRYTVAVWWTAAANYSYDLDVVLTYAPSAGGGGSSNAFNAGPPPEAPLAVAGTRE